MLFIVKCPHCKNEININNVGNVFFSDDIYPQEPNVIECKQCNNLSRLIIKIETEKDDRLNKLRDSLEDSKTIIDRMNFNKKEIL